MARKRPSSRDQKALTILDANLTPVQEQENKLIEGISWDLYLASEMIRFIVRGDGDSEAFFDHLQSHVASARSSMRSLLKLRKEFE